MNKFILALVLGLFTLISFGQTKHPNYGGGHHTKSHGGRYVGGSGAHHKGGHYVNPRTSNTYGRHKRK